MEPFDKYQDRFVTEPNTGCWLWIGTRHRQGYGLLTADGRIVKAHRLFWSLANRQPIPLPRTKICHACDVPECVNPDHLFAGTQADNIRDMERKGRARHLAGSKNGRAKLTEVAVQAIRQRYASGGIRQVDLAKEYGVNQTMVGFIVRREHWRTI